MITCRRPLCLSQGFYAAPLSVNAITALVGQILIEILSEVNVHEQAREPSGEQRENHGENQWESRRESREVSSSFIFSITVTDPGRLTGLSVNGYCLWMRHGYIR